MHPALLEAAGHQRQAVTLPGYHAGRPPRIKGRRYPADPSTVEEIIAVMRTAGERATSAARSGWTPGHGTTPTMAEAQDSASSRRVLLRDPRPNRRPPLGTIIRPPAAAPNCRRSRRETPVCAHQLRHAHAVEMAHEGVPIVDARPHCDVGDVAVLAAPDGRADDGHPPRHTSCAQIDRARAFCVT